MYSPHPDGAQPGGRRQAGQLEGKVDVDNLKMTRGDK